MWNHWEEQWARSFPSQGGWGWVLVESPATTSCPLGHVICPSPLPPHLSFIAFLEGGKVVKETQGQATPLFSRYILAPAKHKYSSIPGLDHQPENLHFWVVFLKSKNRNFAVITVTVHCGTTCIHAIPFITKQTVGARLTLRKVCAPGECRRRALWRFVSCRMFHSKISWRNINRGPLWLKERIRKIPNLPEAGEKPVYCLGLPLILSSVNHLPNTYLYFLEKVVKKQLYWIS